MSSMKNKCAEGFLETLNLKSTYGSFPKKNVHNKDQDFDQDFTVSGDRRVGKIINMDNFSPSNSFSCEKSCDNTLGKTLATSLQLIATGSTELPNEDGHDTMLEDDAQYQTPDDENPETSLEDNYSDLIVEPDDCKQETDNDSKSDLTSNEPMIVEEPTNAEETPTPATSKRRYKTRSSTVSEKTGHKSGKKSPGGKGKFMKKKDKKKVPNDGSVTLYQCDQCNKVFNRMQTLRQHFITHTDRFACEFCNVRCKSKGDLRSHVQTHTKEKPYHCTVCNTNYTRDSILRKHMQTLLHKKACMDSLTTDNDELPHEPKKRKKSKSPYESKNSMKINDLSCGQCSKVFLLKRDLRRHLRYHSLKFVCKICQKRCSCALFLKIHEKRHSKSSVLSCNMCSRSFKTVFYLKDHLKIHRLQRTNQLKLTANEIKLSASKCSKILSYKGNSEPMFHQANQQDDRSVDPKIKSCFICHKVYKNRKALEKHENLHSNGYVCVTCNMKHTSLAKLKQHLKNNHKSDNVEEVGKSNADNVAVRSQTEKASVCKICYAVFESSKELNSHMKNHVPTMLFSGASLEENSIPFSKKAKKNWKGCFNNLKLETDDSDNSSLSSPKMSKKLKKESLQLHELESDEESILDSSDFVDLLECALSSSSGDEEHVESEETSSNDELYSGLQDLLEAQTGNSSGSDVSDLSLSQEQTIVHCEDDIVKKHEGEFEEYSFKNHEENIFQCAACVLSFTDAEILTRHMKSHVCEYCNIFFIKKQDLSSHKANHIKKLKQQIRLETARLYVPESLLKGERTSESDIEMEDFLDELESILDGTRKSVQEVNFLHTLSHDEVVRANKKLFEKHSCVDSINSIFACTICKRKYARPTTLTRHLKTHVCQYCNKFFVDKADLLEHKYKHRKKAALMRANVSGDRSAGSYHTSFLSKENRQCIRKFIQIDTQQGLNKCSLCNKTFARRTVLTRHMRTHICSYCDKFFEDKFDLVKHINTHRAAGLQYSGEEGPDNDVYQEFVEEEEKTFSNNSSLVDGALVDNIESAEKVASLTSSYSSNLPHFASTFQTPANSGNEALTFIQIPTSETQEVSATTPFANTATGTPTYRIDNIGGHESFIVASSSCTGSDVGNMISISPAQQHLIQDGPRMFVCNQCGKRFCKNSHLKSHMLSHSSDKPYECRLCGKSFGKSTALRKHEKTHLKQCKICNSNFTYQCQLDLHMEIHHPYSTFYK